MTTPATPTAPAGPPRRRKPPKPVTVVAVDALSPRLLSVKVTGDDLDAYADAAPTSHLKVFLPADGQDAPLLPRQTPDGLAWAEDGPRPTVRTYTPRGYDPATRILEIQFLLHGEGPASAWARRAKPGDKLAVGGPGGRFSLEPPAAHWLILGDESAIPAIGTLLDAFPDDVATDVHIEVSDADDEIKLGDPAKTPVTWHHRQPPGTPGAFGAFGAELAEVAAHGVIPEGARVWVACEAAAMRGIRRHLIRERAVPAGSLVTRGYWRIGEQNHPDHDYGED